MIANRKRLCSLLVAVLVATESWASENTPVEPTSGTTTQSPSVPPAWNELNDLRRELQQELDDVEDQCEAAQERVDAKVTGELAKITAAHDRFATSTNILSIVVGLTLVVGGLGGAISTYQFIRSKTEESVEKALLGVGSRITAAESAIEDAAKAILRQREESERVTDTLRALAHSGQAEAAAVASMIEQSRDDVARRAVNLEHQAGLAAASATAAREAADEAQQQIALALRGFLASIDWVNGSEPQSPASGSTLNRIDEMLAGRPVEAYSPSDWYDRGLVAEASDRWQDAATFYRRAILGYSDSRAAEPSGVPSEAEARTVLHLSLAEGRLGRFEDVVKLCTEMRDSLPTPLPESWWRTAAWLENNRGWGLGALGLHEDAITAYSNLLERYSTVVPPHVAPAVGRALNGRANSRLMLAKRTWNEPAARDVLIDAAISDLLLAIDLDSRRDLPVGNLAYARWLQGDTAAALPNIRLALELGGPRRYRGFLSAISETPVEPDTAFRGTLERVWQELGPLGT